MRFTSTNGSFSFLSARWLRKLRELFVLTQDT